MRRDPAAQLETSVREVLFRQMGLWAENRSGSSGAIKDPTTDFSKVHIVGSLLKFYKGCGYGVRGSWTDSFYMLSAYNL